MIMTPNIQEYLPLKEFASLEKTLSLRVDPILEDFLHSQKQQKVKKVISLCKIGGKAWKCTNSLKFNLPYLLGYKTGFFSLSNDFKLLN